MPKTAAKKSAPAKRSTNRKPVAAAAAEPKKVVTVVMETKGLTELRDCAQKVHEAADSLGAAVDAAKELDGKPDPGEKRLHRRVHIAIYDGEGTRLSNASHDLKASEWLNVVVEGDRVSVETTGARA